MGKMLWAGSGIAMLMWVAECLWHPLGVSTEALLRGGMVILATFIVMTIVVSIQMGIRSHRQVMARSRRTAKPSRRYGNGYVSDGGYVPAVADVSCSSDGGAGGSDGGVVC